MRAAHATGSCTSGIGSPFLYVVPSKLHFIHVWVPIITSSSTQSKQAVVVVVVVVLVDVVEVVDVVLVEDVVVVVGPLMYSTVSI